MERFFEFPIRIYDGFSLERAYELEDNISQRVEGDWIIGKAKVPFEAVTSMAWHDIFSRAKGVDDVEKEGFDLTYIRTKDYGEFMCTWGRKEFEERLGKFMDKFEMV